MQRRGDPCPEIPQHEPGPTPRQSEANVCLLPHMD